MKTLRSPSILDRIVTRESLPSFMEASGYKRAIEVGTYRGEFAHEILTGWSGHLTCIDPWIESPDYRDGCFTLNDITPDEAHAETLQRLDPWIQAGRCAIARVTSIEAAKQFTAESLDVVYLDGNHAGPVVESEIALYWPLLAPGGMLAGHDFCTRNDDLQACGVADAVWDFAERIGRRPRVTPCSSWFFVKP